MVLEEDAVSCSMPARFASEVTRRPRRVINGRLVGMLVGGVDTIKIRPNLRTTDELCGTGHAYEHEKCYVHPYIHRAILTLTCDINQSYNQKLL